MEYLKQQLSHLIQLHQVLNKKLETCHSVIMGHLVDDAPLPWPDDLEEAVTTQRATLEKLAEIDKRLDQLPLARLDEIEQRLTVGLDHIYRRLDAIDHALGEQTAAVSEVQIRELEELLAEQTPRGGS